MRRAVRSSLGVEGAQCRPGWTASEEGDDCFTVSAPVRELVAGVPSPSSHHRKHESPALAEELSVEVGVVDGDLIGHVGNIELDRAAAACLEVDEEGPFLVLRTLPGRGSPCSS